MYYSDEVVEEVRAGNDIVDVIGSYVKLQKKGANYMGLCPFHGEKTPSFSVSGSRQMYHCFGCGVGGNVFTFLMEYENFTFPEAIRQLAERAGIKLPEEEATPEAKKRADRRMRLFEINKEAAKFYYVRLKGDIGKAAYAYFKKRGLSDEIITRFGLGYSDKSGRELYRYLKSQGYEDEILRDSGLFTFDEKKGVYDKFWNRAMFPIMDGNSKVIGFGGRVMGDGEPKYLNSPETMIFDKSRNLYALNYARQSRKSYFLLCEGYMDVISLHQAGFTNAVASLGTAFTGLQANLIARYVKEVYITYDSDGAGQKAALRAIPILRAAGLSAKVVDMKPYKDPDEFIQALGAEEYEKRVQTARNSFYFEIDVLRSEFDFSDPEQKTNFFRETAKKLLQFSDELERRTYTEAVAKEYQIGFDLLERLVNQYGSAAITGEEQKESVYKERKKQKPEAGYYTSQKLLLTWITTEPVLFEKVKDIVTAEDFTDEFYYEVAKEVFEQYEKEGRVTPARILNHYETKEEQAKAAELFQTTLLGELSEAQKAKAFAETVRKVKQNGIEMRMGRAAETGDLEAMQRAVTEQASLGRTLAKAGL
ncbi:MAG: DNA primase [Lachnospiraceae bacterium]|nr:DNA primase [Lachnospiraceae bacterium]